MSICDQTIIESINLIWLLEKVQEQHFSFFNNGFNKQENNYSASNEKYLDSILDAISTNLIGQMKILKSEIDIDNIFNASPVNNNEKHIKDILRRKLESEDFQEKMELFRQSETAKFNRVHYQSKIPEKENIDIENLLQENYILKKQLEDYNLKQTEFENKLLQENSKKFIQIQSSLTQSNQDLEEQINECFELYSQIKTLKDNETSFRNSLFNVISKFGKVPETLTTSDLFMLLDKYIDNKHCQTNAISCPTNDVMNESILDLEQFHTDIIFANDSPCNIFSEKIKPKSTKSKLPKLFPSSRKSNSGNNGSLISLESFHLNNSKDDLCTLSDKSDKLDLSNVLPEKLDKLDWDDVDKMEMLVEKSFHIFTETIIDLYSNNNESFVQRLKNCINEFTQILTGKVKTCQLKKIDLNSTCVFEKLEHELELEAANAELNEQLNIALTEKSRIELDLEKEKSDNQSLNSKLEHYLNIISGFEEEKNRISDNNSLILQALHAKVEDFKLANSNLESNLNSSLQSVESYEVKFKDLETEIAKLVNEKHNVQLEIINLNEIKEKFSATSDQLIILQDNHKILINELEDKNKLINQLEEKLSSLEKEDDYQNLINLKHACECESQKDKEVNNIEEQSNCQATALESMFENSFHLSNEILNLDDSVTENESVILRITPEDIDRLKIDLEEQKEQYEILKTKLEEKENIIKDILNEQLIWLNTNDELKKQVEIKEFELTKVKFDFEEMKSENYKNMNNCQMEKDVMQAEINEHLNLIENLKKPKEESNNYDEVNELTISLQNIENENNNLKLRLLEKENMIYSVTEELKAKNEEIVSIKQQMQLTKDAISIINEKNALQDESIQNELMNNYEKLEQDFEQLKLLIPEKEKEIICLKEEIIGLESKLEESENKLVEWTKNQTEIENLNKELVKALEKDLELLTNSMSEKEKEITALNDNIIDLQLKLEGYENQFVEERKNILIEIENLKLYSETKENELLKLQNNLDSALGINRFLEEKIEELNTDLVKTTGKDLELLTNSMSEKEKEITALNDNIIDLQLKLEGYENQLVEESEKSLIEIENLKLYSKTKEAELIKLENEHENIVEKQNLLQRINRSLELAIEDLNANQVKTTEEFVEEITFLKKEISQKQEIISQLSDNKAAVELDLEFLKNQLKLTIEKIEEDREEFQLFNINAKKTETRLERELEKSISGFQILQTDFSICQNLTKEKENEIRTITEANEIFENELELLKTHFDKVKFELAYREQEFVKLQSDFEAISNELTMMKSKEKLLEQSLSSVNDDLKTQKAKFENELELLRKQSELKIPESRDVLQLEIDKLKCELVVKEKLIASQRESVQTFDVLVGHYNDLKSRYRAKRTQMEALDLKFRQIKEERDNYKRLLNKD